MLTHQSPVSGDPIHRPKSGRRALTPINNHAIKPISNSNPIPSWTEISLSDDPNKENPPIYATPKKMESIDGSLAEELSAIREKRERLKLDKEKTERMLTERDLALEMQMEEIEKRREEQKVLEIEVDRLYRLNELRALCMRKSPIRSLREREQEKKVKEDKLQVVKIETEDKDNSESSSSGQSQASEIDTEK